MARVHGVDFSEVEALAKALGERGPKVEREISKALTASINRIHAAAKAAAPFDTGELEGSVQKSRARGLSRAVWSDKRQGIFQEFGTSQHPPQPWITPALRAEAPNFERAVREVASAPLEPR